MLAALTFEYTYRFDADASSFNIFLGFLDLLRVFEMYLDGQFFFFFSLGSIPNDVWCVAVLFEREGWDRGPCQMLPASIDFDPVQRSLTGPKSILFFFFSCSHSLYDLLYVAWCMLEGLRSSRNCGISVFTGPRKFVRCFLLQLGSSAKKFDRTINHYVFFSLSRSHFLYDLLYVAWCMLEGLRSSGVCGISVSTGPRKFVRCFLLQLGSNSKKFDRTINHLLYELLFLFFSLCRLEGLR